MHSLRTISQSMDLASAPRPSDSGTLLRPSPGRLSAATEDALSLMMAQTLARFPKQELLPLTTDMYLVEWEEMVLRSSVSRFQAALLRVIRNRDRPPFFPEPHEIDAELLAEEHAERAAKAKLVAACEVCTGLGYTLSTNDKGDRFAKDCVCRRQAS